MIHQSLEKGEVCWGRGTEAQPASPRRQRPSERGAARDTKGWGDSSSKCRAGGGEAAGSPSPQWTGVWE